MCDFETTSTENVKRDGETRVWLYNIRRISDLESIQTGTTIEEYFKFISSDSGTHYFHNLKFDGMFIIYELFKRGYKYVEKLDGGKQFTTLISSTGLWYNIKINHELKWGRYIRTNILDSYKKLPRSASAIAKGFNLKTLKGDIDYTKYREVGYIPTKEEIEYVENDTLIIAQALKEQFDQELTKMTIGSDALHSFKRQMGKRKYDYFFPQLEHSLDADLRMSYKGGYVYLNPIYTNKILENVIAYDINSHYPSEMYHQYLPFGNPIYFEGEYVDDSMYPLHISVIRCNFELKEGYIPTIQLKNNFRFNPTEYLTSSDGDSIQMILTSVDLDQFKEHYNIIEIEYVQGWKFKQVKGLFNSYIDKWMNIKNTTHGAKREIAKFMLNSLYGKFGTNDIHESHLPYLDYDEVIQFNRSEETLGKTVYTAMASFITSYGRFNLIDSIQRIGLDKFVYCDTDSMKLVNITKEEVEKILRVDSKKLGYWDYEGHGKRAKFLRAKTYLMENDGVIDVICAGMPNRVKENVSLENFRYGSVFEGKLMPVSVKGGIYLKDTNFTIKLI